MLSNSGLEKNFWAEVVRTACYLINRSPTIALDGGIPEEVWTGKNLNYSHLKIFGCEAFVHIPKEARTNLDDKSMKCIFFGYADEELWDPVKNKIIRSKDVIFNESELFKRTVGELEVKKIIDRFEEQQENIPPMQENEQQQNEVSTTTIDTIISQRKEKADKMRISGIDPYPARVKIEHKIEQVRNTFDSLQKEEFAKESVTVAGRMMSRRDLKIL